MVARIRPDPGWFANGLSPRFSSNSTTRLGVRMLAETRPAECPGPLRTRRALPVAPRRPATRRWALPHPHRYYRPMRQTKTLPPSSVHPYRASLCRLSLRPAGRWPFPTLSPQSMHGCLDPYPAVSLQCECPFLPEGLRPHPNCHEFGTPNNRRNATSTTNSFRGCSHSFMFRLPCLLDPPVAPTTAALWPPGGRAVYTTQNPGGYPTWAVASLRA